MAAPTSNPKKDRIADAVLTALEGISTGGGYYTNAGDNATRGLQAMASVNDYPALFLLAGDEEGQPNNLGTGCKTSDAEFIVYGYVNKPDVDTDVIKLEADIKKAVLTDHTQGGLASTTEFLDLSPDLEELLTNNLGLVAVRFAVRYQWDVTDL